MKTFSVEIHHAVLLSYLASAGRGICCMWTNSTESIDETTENVNYVPSIK